MLERSYPQRTSSASECKPDYERLILQAKDAFSKNLKLQDAIFDYVAVDMRLSGKMAELLGELVSESRQLKTKIDSLIKQQERED